MRWVVALLTATAMSLAPVVKTVVAEPVHEGLYMVEVVNGQETFTYEIELAEGEWIDLLLSGDGNSELELVVMDEFGNVVVFDHPCDWDQCMVSFEAEWAGIFTICVINHGGLPNEFMLYTC